MQTDQTLYDVYRELANSEEFTVYVVPLIRFDYKQSDYLYLLYKKLYNKKGVEIKTLSYFDHWKIGMSGIKNSKKVLHYHWLECSDIRSLLGMLYKFINIFIYTSLGGKLVWTIHNKMPHDGRFIRLNFRLRKWMANRADRLHIHCKTMIPEISEFYGVSESKFVVVPHPKFPAKQIDRKIAVEEINHLRNLGLSGDDTIYLMFGNISHYKQIDEVCRIFKTLDDNKKLLIVGPVKKGQMPYFNQIKKLSKESSNIRLVPHFIKEENVPFYFNASDCVLFNYRDILTSGGVELANSYDKPIIAPKLGCIKELSGENHILFETKDEFIEAIQSIGETK